MPRTKRKPPQQCDSLPESFDSLEEFWGFWDTHSTADYEDLMQEVDVGANIRSSKVYCAVAKDLIAQLRAEAHRQGVPTTALIHLWLAEKLRSTSRRK